MFLERLLLMRWSIASLFKCAEKSGGEDLNHICRYILLHQDLRVQCQQQQSFYKKKPLSSLYCSGFQKTESMLSVMGDWVFRN